MNARQENTAYGLGGLLMCTALAWAGVDAFSEPPLSTLDYVVGGMAFAVAGVTLLFSLVLLLIAARGGRRG